MSQPANQLPNAEDRNAEDWVQLIEYTVVSVERGKERVLPGACSRCVLSSGEVRGCDLDTWLIARYPTDHRVDTPTRYLRVAHEVIGAWPKPPLHFREEQLRRLAGIRRALLSTIGGYPDPNGRAEEWAEGWTEEPAEADSPWPWPIHSASAADAPPDEQAPRAPARRARGRQASVSRASLAPVPPAPAPDETEEAAPEEAAPEGATPEEATPEEATPEEATPEEAAAEEPAAEETAPAASRAEEQDEDHEAPPLGGGKLTDINGLGPASARMLTEAGIETLDDLAATDVDTLADLFDGKFGISGWETWPGRARELIDER